MSEGINFSDSLARCIIVAGMPFPDTRDPLLREKLSHSDRMEPNSGKALYEAMCMKVVNQSIGRSIRHANDYASILLLDKRYSGSNIITQLPAWISSNLQTPSTFEHLKENLLNFFAASASSVR